MTSLPLSLHHLSTLGLTIPPFITSYTWKDIQLNFKQLLIDRRSFQKLIFDLFRKSTWGRENMVVVNTSKAQLSHLSTLQNISHNYNVFANTQLKQFPFLNIFGISFPYALSWNVRVLSLTKEASKRLGYSRISSYQPSYIETLFALTQSIHRICAFVPPTQPFLKGLNRRILEQSTLLLSITLCNLFPVVSFSFKLLYLSLFKLLQYIVLSSFNGLKGLIFTYLLQIFYMYSQKPKKKKQ